MAMGELATAAKQRIVIVGGTSRVGGHLRKMLCQRPLLVVHTIVRKSIASLESERLHVVRDYFALPGDILSQADVVVNLVGITAGAEEELRAANVRGPLRLAAAAKASGVRHFVQLSSLSVYGGAPEITHQTPVQPTTAYGHSKADADQGLCDLVGPNFAVTCLRVPIIYGPNVGTKLLLLAKTITRMRLLPLPPVPNRRSVIHLHNLAAAIVAIISEHLYGLQFAADPDPLTLSLLAEVASKQAGTPVYSFTLPASVLSLLRRVTPALYDSLYGNSLIQQNACVNYAAYGRMPLLDGLRDLLS